MKISLLPGRGIEDKTYVYYFFKNPINYTNFEGFSIIDNI